MISNFAKKALIAVSMTLAASAWCEEKDMSIVLDKKNASPFNGGVFEGWGTSFCWWANRIGYSDKLAKEAAKAFYTEEGLGFNIIRYNVGGGDDPSHHHITRTDSAIPGFMEKQADGTFAYNWEADHNQRNVLREAVKACGQDVIVEAFSNSPPYFMTNSGCSSGAEEACNNNLRDDQYEAFADYMATVMEELQKRDGVKFQSCSPMNEPATGYWGANSWKQEGCHFDIGESQSRMLVEMRKALDKHGLKKVILSGTDETSIDTQYISFQQLSPEAAKAITRVDTHSYIGVGRKELREQILAANKNLWMSEVDGGDCAGVNAGEMGCPLWMANRILDDMNGLLPSAWIMWQAIDQHKSAEGYNGNKDWYAQDLTGGYWGLCICDHDEQYIRFTKKYYAVAQFSRYIRPGSTILVSSPKTLAAYDKNRKQIIVVAVNDKAEEKELSVDLSSFKKVGSKARVVRTSGTLADGENTKELSPVTLDEKSLRSNLLSNSITTFIIDDVL